MSATLNAVKASLSVAENLAFWAEFLGEDGAESRRRACRLRAWPLGRSSRRSPLGRTETAARAVAPVRRARARSGCSTSRRPRSTPPRVKLLDAAIEASSRDRRHRRSSRATPPLKTKFAQQARARQGARRVSAALALLNRDVKLAFREGGAIGIALGFYLVVVAITPLGLGPDLNLLARIAPGMLWVALLLAALLSADRIFHNDYEDGALDVLITGTAAFAARRRDQEPRPLAHHRRAAGAARAAARASAQSAGCRRARSWCWPCWPARRR